MENPSINGWNGWFGGTPMTQETFKWISLKLGHSRNMWSIGWTTLDSGAPDSQTSKLKTYPISDHPIYRKSTKAYARKCCWKDLKNMASSKLYLKQRLTYLCFFNPAHIPRNSPRNWFGLVSSPAKLYSCISNGIWLVTTNLILKKIKNIWKFNMSYGSHGPF